MFSVNNFDPAFGISLLVLKPYFFNFFLSRYVPDTSKVRQKMLYASSKKDLLLKLGDSLFTDDSFYVGEASDLTYEGLINATRKATEAERSELMTEAEQAYEDELQQEYEELPEPAVVNVAKSGGAVPFRFDEKVSEALKEFANGTRLCVEIKIHPKKEICQLGDLDGQTKQENLKSAISDSLQVLSEPRFYMVNYGSKIFVYCCPELSKVCNV